MPVTGLRQEFELATRNAHTTVKCEIGLKVDGRELPNMAILGDAVESAIALIREKVGNSYKIVPERL